MKLKQQFTLEETVLVVGYRYEISYLEDNYTHIKKLTLAKIVYHEPPSFLHSRLVFYTDQYKSELSIPVPWILCIERI